MYGNFVHATNDASHYTKQMLRGSRQLVTGLLRESYEELFPVEISFYPAGIPWRLRGAFKKLGCMARSSVTRAGAWGGASPSPEKNSLEMAGFGELWAAFLKFRGDILR